MCVNAAIAVPAGSKAMLAWTSMHNFLRINTCETAPLGDSLQCPMQQAHKLAALLVCLHVPQGGGAAVPGSGAADHHSPSASATSVAAGNCKHAHTRDVITSHTHSRSITLACAIYMPATTCSTTLVARKSQGLILAMQWYKPSSGTSHAVVQAIQWH